MKNLRILCLWEPFLDLQKLANNTGVQTQPGSDEADAQGAQPYYCELFVLRFNSSPLCQPQSLKTGAY